MPMGHCQLILYRFISYIIGPRPYVLPKIPPIVLLFVMP